jgi:ABC-type branched-subunit amino acid transport system substrate-binding protein
LTACGGDEKAANARIALTVGDSVPLTGYLSDFGPAGRKGADIAETWIRNANRVAAMDDTVSVLHEDNRSDSREAVEGAQRLAAKGAECITGAWAPFDTVAIAEKVSVPRQLLQISPASTSTQLTHVDDDGYLNRVPPADNLQGRVLAGVVADQLGGARGKSINVAARNDSYGRALADDLTRAWTRRGGKVSDKLMYQPEQPSYNSEADRIATGNPDAFVIIDFPETFSKLGPALERTGNWEAGRTFVTDGLVSADLLEDPGPDVVDGVRGIAPGTPSAGLSARSFDRLFDRSSPKNVGRQTFDAHNFDAVILCYLSAVAAGSASPEQMKEELRAVSGPPGEKFSWEQLPRAIKALRDGKDVDYEGASGPIDLDSNGDPTAGIYDVVEFKGRQIKSIKQVEAADILREAG